MQNEKAKSPLILLAHSKIAAFDWGKILIDTFRRQASKRKLTLHIVYHYQEIKYTDMPVIVLGVDSEWLHEVFAYFQPTNTPLLLLNGTADNFPGNINLISVDQQALTRQCITLLRDANRTKTAFFGAQKNDTSDALKTITFLKYFPQQDVYYVHENLEDTCAKFLENIENYDSVICANDAMAIYLLKRCRTCGIQIPEQLFLIGNGNLWLSEHVTPSITTITSDPEVMAEIALQIQKTLHKFPSCTPIQVQLNGTILPRESTASYHREDKFPNPHTYARYTADYPSQFPCPQLAQVCNLDRILSLASDEKRKILRLVSKGFSYRDISEKVFLSEDTIHYHLKKVYKQLCIHSKNEFIQLLNDYGITL